MRGFIITNFSLKKRLEKRKELRITLYLERGYQEIA